MTADLNAIIDSWRLSPSSTSRGRPTFHPIGDGPTSCAMTGAQGFTREGAGKRAAGRRQLPHPSILGEGRSLMARLREMGIGIQASLAAKEFSAAEVTRGTFERIGEADGAVHAWKPPELARRGGSHRRRRRRGTPAEMGPLAGVPWAKDSLNLTGTHTTCSSNMLRDYVSPARRPAWKDAARQRLPSAS
ncbi:MAG: hypothetical protein ACLUW6_04230 [Coriobacteriaceae bacterium]